jgi:hypothetical protein
MVGMDRWAVPETQRSVGVSEPRRHGSGAALHEVYWPRSNAPAFWGAWNFDSRFAGQRQWKQTRSPFYNSRGLRLIEPRSS